MGTLIILQIDILGIKLCPKVGDGVFRRLG